MIHQKMKYVKEKMIHQKMKLQKDFHLPDDEKTRNKFLFFFICCVCVNLLQCFNDFERLNVSILHPHVHVKVFFVSILHQHVHSKITEKLTVKWILRVF